MTITSATVINGAATQFGTYTGFTSAPVTVGDGVVLSTGLATQTTAAFHNNGSAPDTITGAGGTPEFNSYGPGHITNFNSSNDVAALQVNFTLSAPSKVGFDFAFGSVEFPAFTSSFTDAFTAFLDGTAVSNQIVFDASNQAVQVGSTFASALSTADTNTAFSKPHGLLKLQTFTLNQLAAGAHTLTFEVADVNDSNLDSAVFISNFHAGDGSGGTTEPGKVLLGTAVKGSVKFGTKPLNYFDRANHFVPAGFENAASDGASVVVSGTTTEFGYLDGAGPMSAEFTDTTLTLKETATVNGHYLGQTFSFKDDAFTSLTPLLVSTDFPGGLTVSGTGDEITFNWGGTTLTSPSTWTAVYSFAPRAPFSISPVPEPSTVLLCMAGLSVAALFRRKLGVDRA